MKKLISIISVLVILVSCKTQNATNSTPAVSTTTAVNNTAFFKAIQKKSDFESVKITSKINVESGQYIPALDGTIYIENEKKVWVNFSALLFNVARGIATPTGIKAYEKWNKTYIDSDFAYMNNLLNVNFIDYLALQNLLTGKNFIPIKEQDFVLTKNAQGFNLSSTKNQKIIVDNKVNEYKVSLDFSPELHLNYVLLQDVKTSQNLEVYYSNWTLVGNQNFPKNVKIIIKAEKTSQILIENTKFDFLKMETPFSIPSNYTKQEIR